MDKELKNNLTAGHKWVRLFFMIAFAVVNYFAQLLIWVIAIVQFILSLVTGRPNKNLLSFSYGLSGFVFHIVKYLQYNEEEKPFPFASWTRSEKHHDKTLRKD